MLIRATIVLLAVLNLGVAAWWLWRPAPVQQPFEQPAGVPRLVLTPTLGRQADSEPETGDAHPGIASLDAADPSAAAAPTSPPHSPRSPGAVSVASSAAWG